MPSYYINASSKDWIRFLNNLWFECYKTVGSHHGFEHKFRLYRIVGFNYSKRKSVDRRAQKDLADSLNITSKELFELYTDKRKLRAFQREMAREIQKSVTGNMYPGSRSG